MDKTAVFKTFYIVLTSKSTRSFGLQDVLDVPADGLGQDLFEVFDERRGQLLFDVGPGGGVDGVAGRLVLHHPRSADVHSGVHGLVVEVDGRHDPDGFARERQLSAVVLAVGGGHGVVGLAGQVHQAELHLGGVYLVGVVHLGEVYLGHVVLGVVRADVFQLDVAVPEAGRGGGGCGVVGRDLTGLVGQVRPDGPSDAHHDLVVHVVGHGGRDVLAHDVLDEVTEKVPEKKISF